MWTRWRRSILDNYTLNNPVNYVDPNGLWTEDKEGNLVAEKGDHLYSLQTYLDEKYGNGEGSYRTDELRSAYSDIKWGANQGKDGLKVGQKLSKSKIPGFTIGDKAENHLNSTDWNYEVSRGDYGEDTNKCNVFVGETLDEAGVGTGKPRLMNPGRSRLPWVSKKWGYPVAGDWADPNIDISGWSVLGPNDKPRRGDVAVYSFNYRDASGHIAIVVGNGHTVGTSGRLRRIAKTDFGFNPAKSNNQPIIFRRYTGK